MDALAALIDKVRDGDQTAYSEIVRRFQDMAIGYARAMLRDADLAEDAAQEAFIEAYVHLDQLQEPAAFPGWFRRIVFKRCDRMLRKQHVPVVPLDEELSAQPSHPQAERGQQELLQQAIQQLPLEERALITLFYLRQFTLPQIAEFLEVPATTLNNRLHRARNHLRKELFAMTETNQPPTKTADTAFAGRIQEQVEALTALHDALTRPLTRILSSALDGAVEVRVESVNHTLAYKVVQWFPYPCCTYSFKPEGSQQRIFFDIHMELAAAIVGRDIGIGEAIRAADLGQLSRDELERSHPHGRSLMEEIVGLWDNTIAMEVINPEIETSPVLIIADPTQKVADAEDPVFHVKFAVKWDGRESAIDLCYPAPSLAAGLERLRASAAR